MRFQLKSVLAAACLLAASALSAAAFEATTVEPSELRQGPSWDFEPIAELPAGSIVEVLNCDRSFCEVSVEDYDGFLPRGVLDLGGSSVPFYAFPPQIAAPALWHGRYYSRDHYRYESRARWRDREGRRLHVVPLRPQPRPLRPIGPNEWRGKKQFDKKGPPSDQRGKKQFDPNDQRRGKKQFDQKGPADDQRRIQRGPDQPRIQRGPDQPRIQQQQKIQQQPKIQQQQKIQQQAPVQRQAPPPPPRAAPAAEKQKKKSDTK
jgi:hypothetical protein